MSIYELKNVNLKYGDGDNSVDALQNINLSINKGEVVAITGPSGSGKSTLLNVMSCLDKPSSGSVFFNKEDVVKLSQKQLSALRKLTRHRLLEFLITYKRKYDNNDLRLRKLNKQFSPMQW